MQKMFREDLDDLIECSREGNPLIDQFECSVFDGRYVTGDIDAGYLSDLEVQRSDEAKMQRDAASKKAKAAAEA